MTSKNSTLQKSPHPNPSPKEMGKNAHHYRYTSFFEKFNWLVLKIYN